MAKQIIGNLYISDAENTKNIEEEQIDKVISVCEEEYSTDALNESVKDVIRARVMRKTVCVHCPDGFERSGVVCIAALGIVEGMTYDHALARVRNAVTMLPSKKMLEDAKQFIEKRR